MQIKVLILVTCIMVNILNAKDKLEIDPFTPFVSSNDYVKHPYGLDENGILYYDYGKRYNLGKYNNPTFIAAYANALYRDYINSDDKLIKNIFFKQVDFLIENAEKDKEGGFSWIYPFENEHYNVPAGWYSGMTSGRILGVLVRAHYLSDDDKYLKIAKKVFEKFSKPLEQGGMITYIDNNTAWIEEVAHKDIPSYKVLNGHIFGLAGLISYAKYTKDEKALELMQKAINAVKYNLDSFDAGFISYYSESMPNRNRPFAEKGGYNYIQIWQMLYLYKITQDEAFLKKAMKFQEYENYNPLISTTFSTNEKTHGPDKMNLTFGNNYWSSYKFPVSITLDLGEEYLISGLTILGHSLKSTPKNFIIYSSLDGEKWQGLAKELDNNEQYSKINFTYNVNARYIKIEVFSDNGNKAVALDGIAVHKVNNLSPIINFNNYRSSFKKLFDKDLNSSIMIYNDLELIVPMNKNRVTIIGDFSQECIDNVRLFESNNLKEWKNVTKNVNLNKKEITIINSNYHYKKIVSNGCEESKISEVVYAN
ncbi:MAG: D-glucuronyl C5-epimerase family protein [Candidatus Altimarinota bacterium]